MYEEMPHEDVGMGDHWGNPESGYETYDTEPEVYVHTLTGSDALSTIRLKGQAKGRTLTILVDSGATHSFLDPRVAKDTGYELKDAPAMAVTAANGGKMFSQHTCNQFLWQMQGETFQYDFRVLKLGGVTWY